MQIIELLKGLWARIPSSWKYEALSLTQTFLAGFIAEIAINLANLGYQIEVDDGISRRTCSRGGAWRRKSVRVAPLQAHGLLATNKAIKRATGERGASRATLETTTRSKTALFPLGLFLYLHFIHKAPDMLGSGRCGILRSSA